MRQPIFVHVTQPTQTEYVTREVHEHRAPTDESVKILKEMERAAEAKVIEAIKVGDTTFECVVHRALDHMSDEVVMRAVFGLNGKKETAEHRVGTRTLRDDGEPALWIGLRDEIAKVIATRMIESAMRKK